MLTPKRNAPGAPAPDVAATRPTRPREAPLGRARPRDAQPCERAVPPQRPARSRYHVEALGRGLALLDCFVGPGPQLTLGALAERLGVNKGTTFRMLRTLEDAGFVQHDAQTRRYQLSLKVLDLGNACLDALSYPVVALPFLEALREELQEAAGMAVLDGENVRYVARASAHRITSVELRVGTALPAHATSLGKVMLAELDAERIAARYGREGLETYSTCTTASVSALQAELDDVRRLGYAIAEDELGIGICSVAAPVYASPRRLLAAIDVTIRASDDSRERLLTRCLPALRRTAQALSARFGTVPF
jgi:IclR family pca regulon transcriptional regulator